MKRLMILVLSLMVFCSVFLGCDTAQAEDTASIPVSSKLSTNVGGIDFGLVDVQAGMYYDFKTERVYAGAEASVVSYKNLLSLGAGYMTTGQDAAFLLGAHANLSTLAGKWGWNYELPVAVQLGVFTARHVNFSQAQVVDNDAQKWFMGVCLNIVKTF